MLKDGINPNTQVNPVAAESSSSEENEQAEEMHGSEEIQTFEEFGRSGRAEKRPRSKDASRNILTTMMAVTAVVVLTVSPISIMEPIFGPVMDPVLGPIFGEDDVSGVMAEFVSVEASDDTVWYTVTIAGLEGGEDVSVSLSNRFTDRSSGISGDHGSGMQSGLKPGMTYTLSVIVDGESIADRTVKTLREVETFFHLYGAECTCTEDGMFHFSVEIRDGGVQSGFRAVLTDWYGHSSEVALDSGSGEYTVSVTDAGLIGDTAVLSVYCTEEDDGGTREVVLTEEEFNI